jgi:hypothetical protein
MTDRRMRLHTGKELSDREVCEATKRHDMEVDYCTCYSPEFEVVTREVWEDRYVDFLENGEDVEYYPTIEIYRSPENLEMEIDLRKIRTPKDFNDMLFRLLEKKGTYAELFLHAFNQAVREIFGISGPRELFVAWHKSTWDWVNGCLR